MKLIHKIGDLFLGGKIPLLIGLHWLLVMVALWLRNDLTRAIHFAYEPLLFQFLLIVDYPSIVSVEGMGFEVSTSLFQSSIPTIGMLVAMITLQWILMGVACKLIVRIWRGDPGERPSLGIK